MTTVLYQHQDNRRF